MEDTTAGFPPRSRRSPPCPASGAPRPAAIAAIAFRIRAAILDGNVKRVLARFHAVEGYPGDARVAAGALGARRGAHAAGADCRLHPGDHGSRRDALYAHAPGLRPLPDDTTLRAHAAGATQRFPAARPRRTLPVRQVRMYLLIDAAGRCLLERRPAERASGAASGRRRNAPHQHPGRGLRGAFGRVAIGRRQTESAPGYTFRHGFTHFHLDIEPVYVQLAELRRGSDRSPRPVLVLAGRTTGYRAVRARRQTPRNTRASRRHRHSGRSSVMTRIVHCRKYRQDLEGLDAPPIAGSARRRGCSRRSPGGPGRNGRACRRC